jgi:sialate O-acetylesterase
MLAEVTLRVALALLCAGCCDAAGSSAPARAPASLSLHHFVSSHMVLAREPLAAVVWGNATAGKVVTVSLGGGGSWKSPPAAANGSWSVELPPQPAGVGHTLTVTDGSTTLKLGDIAFGDVYLCTGQVEHCICTRLDSCSC